MEGFSLSELTPLILSSSTEGRSLRVVFRCPSSRIQVPVTWTSPPNGTSGVIIRDQHTARYQVREQVNGVIREFLGFGHVGRWARGLADSALAGNFATQLTTEEEERGVLEAFMSVSSQFARSNGRWVHASVVGVEPDPFQQLIGTRPLEGYEREVAARMMYEVAASSDGLSSDETLFLTELVEESIASLSTRPPLTTSELRQVTAPARRQLLTLAWAMALADEHHDPKEEAVIEAFGEQMQVSIEERIQLKQQAQTFVLEQFLERVTQRGSYDQTARLQLEQLGARLGVRSGAVEGIEARFLARHHPN